MKQFLRFQISGLTAVFWAVLFIVPYIDWQALKDVGNNVLTFIGIATIALALPLGTIIHQVSITILSPFRQCRFFTRRRVLDDLKSISTNNDFETSDPKNQFALVYAQAWNGNSKEDEWPDFDMEHIRTEISNRYSYYYVRIDNGLFAPLVGFGISRLLVYAGWSIVAKVPTCQSLILPIFASALLSAVMMVAYVPALLHEVDDIERFLIKILSRRLLPPGGPDVRPGLR